MLSELKVKIPFHKYVFLFNTFSRLFHLTIVPIYFMSEFSYAPKIKCPVLIIHGTEDSVVPFCHAPELLSHISAQFRVKPFYAKGMGHNNIEMHKEEEYICRITHFLQRCIPIMQCNDRQQGNVSYDSLRSNSDQTNNTPNTYSAVAPDREKLNAGLLNTNLRLTQEWIYYWNRFLEESFQFKNQDNESAPINTKIVASPTSKLDGWRGFLIEESFEEFEILLLPKNFPSENFNNTCARECNDMHENMRVKEIQHRPDFSQIRNNYSNERIYV